VRVSPSGSTRPRNLNAVMLRDVTGAWTPDSRQGRVVQTQVSFTHLRPHLFWAARIAGPL